MTLSPPPASTYQPLPSVSRERLKARFIRVSDGLRGALRPLLEEALGGSDLRPSLITEKLGVDKSQASRISRALRTEEPMELLHEIPTPQGLTSLISVCTEAGASEEGLARAREEVAALRVLLDEFPGGRNDLDAALAAWIPSLRETALRKARREVFRGWSTIMGMRSACHYIAYFVMPSETEGRLDTLWLTSRQGLRRLREGEPVEIAGIATIDPETFGQRRSLDGSSFLEEPRAMVSNEYTSLALSSFTVLEENDRRILLIDGDSPEINHPVNVTIGGWTRSHFDDRVSKAESYLWTDTVSRQPTESLVIDFFVHRDVKTGGDPVVTRIIDGSRSYSSSSVPSDLGQAALGNGPELVPIETCRETAELDPAGLPEVERWREMLEHAAGVRGHRLADFNLFRLKEEFPLPMYLTGIWLPLAP